MENTPSLSLPYILPSQAQKHVTHNEALDRLDALVQLTVLDRNRSSPPPAPAEGDRHIVASPATEDWAGRAGQIACRRDGRWDFYAPAQGWIAFITGESAQVYFNGQEWSDLGASLAALQNLPYLGLGAEADAQNSFSAKLNNALWAAKTTQEGGSGDMRYVLNKQSTANVLSLLMQSNWQGRAEIGLVGDDNLSIKVSPDGAIWREAMAVDRRTGKTTFPQSNLLSDFAVSLLPDSGRFAGNAAKTEIASAFTFPSYLALYNGASAASAGKFIANNTDYGGTAGALDPEIRSLVDLIRGPAYRRYGVEFFAARITAGAGVTAAPVTIGGVDYFYSLYLAFGPRAPNMTFHVYLRALDGPIVYKCLPGQTICRNGAKGSEHILIAPSDGWQSITVVDEQDPYSSNGYNPTPFNIYAAQAGHRYLIACPALMGGVTAIDDNVGVIAGINRWLP